VGQRCRLVSLIGEADDEGNLPGRLRELEPAWKRERGIEPGPEQQHLDLAAGHGLRQRRYLSVGRDLAIGRVGTEAHGLAQRAHGGIEEVDGRERLHGVGARDRHATAHGEGGLAVSERLGHVLDRLHGDAALLGHLLDVDARNRLRESTVAPAALQEHLQNGERELAFGTRGIADPLVGVRGGERLPRLDVNERPRPAIAEGVHAGKAACVIDVREPRLQEVRPEGQHDLGVLEGVVGNGIAAERRAIRGAHRFVGERLDRHPPSRAQRPRPRVHESAQTAVLELGHEGDGSALAGRAHGGDLLADRLEGVVPADRREPGAVASLRAVEAIGMVESLERRLPAHAQRALAHGVIGIPLELHHAPLAIAGDHSTARRTLPAHRREPRGHSGNHLVVGHHQRQDPLAGGAAAGGGGDARRSHDLEEVAPVHELMISGDR
jgi:hypothetical protein